MSVTEHKDNHPNNAIRMAECVVTKQYTIKQQDGCQVMARATASDLTLATWDCELCCATPFNYMTFVFECGHMSRRSAWQSFLHESASDAYLDFGSKVRLVNNSKECIVEIPDGGGVFGKFGIHKESCHFVLSKLFEELKSRAFAFCDDA